MPSVVIYARKSTESEDRQILSIDSQIKELKDFAARESIEVARVFTESMSAKAPGRPIFGEIMRQVHQGRIHEIVCWKLDRLARNPVDGGALIWAVEEHKLKTIHTPQRAFLNSGNDKFWMQLEFGMAKKYVDDLSDNVKRGLRARLERGWACGRTPIGYLNDRNQRTTVKDAGRFALVRRLWDFMLTGNYSPLSILQLANEKWGLRTPKLKRTGGGKLTISLIYKIFRNPFYMGLIRHSGELYKGAHDPMVTPEEFERVQKTLASRSRPRPQIHKFSYTGMIRCGECRSAITAEHKTNRQGHRYIYYHCTRRPRGVHCSQKVIEVRELERQISAFLASLSISPDLKNWTFRLLRDLRADDAALEQSETRSRTRRYGSCKEEISKLIDLRLRGLLSDPDFVAKKNELESERAHLRELIEDNDGRFTNLSARCEEVFNFAAMAKSKFDNGTTDEKRAILRFTGSNLTLLNGILRIDAQKPLALIKNALGVNWQQRERLEPGDSGEGQRETSSPKPALLHWQALVKDVRTFLLKSAREIKQFR